MMAVEDEMMARWASGVVEARRRLAYWYAMGIQLPYSPFHAAQAQSLQPPGGAAPFGTRRGWSRFPNK